MITPEYSGHDPKVRSWAREVAEWMRLVQSEVEELSARPTGHPSAQSDQIPRYRLHASKTTAANFTLDDSMLNMVHVVKNTDGSPIDVTLPGMSLGDWVIVVNDSASSSDINVKDKDANTIATVTVGSSSGDIMVDISGVEAPL